MVTAAIDPVQEVFADPRLAQPVAVPVPIRQSPRHHWVRWELVAAVVVAVAITVQLWRTHSQNAIRYETVAAERGIVQASVTATGTVNAVVDVQVGSQVSGNIQALLCGL
jgi:HlyD family secretion protein